MEDQTFELSGVEFGKRGSLLVTDFDPGVVAFRGQTVDRAQADGRLFGRSFATPSTWTWEITVNEHDDVSALDRLAAFSEAWRADSVRFTPGAVLPLRYQLAGRVRRVYGRPGRFQHKLDVLHLQGAIGVTCDFERADALHYEDEQRQHSVGLAVASIGGFKTPFVTPITSQRNSAPTQSTFTVGGTAPTWAEVQIRGPVARPRVSLDGVLLGEWTANLAYDEVLSINPLPWVTAVTKNGAPADAGQLGRTRMSRMLLTPGSHQLVYEGADSTGSSRATVLWRGASNSL